MTDDDSIDDPCDPRQDHFRPPSIPTLVWCLHCEEEYDSWKMHYEIETDAKGRKHGLWCCGTPGCDGIGFGFDIHPVDEDYIDPDGRDMGEWVETEPFTKEDHPDRPPDEPTPVRCEKCGKDYSSADMVWEEEEEDPDMNWWVCPTEGCHGMGFGMDVRPTDPNYIDALGRKVWRPGEKPKPINEGDIPF